MFRKSIFSACLIVAGGSFTGQIMLGSSTAQGQEYVLDEIYGRGVHRFFAYDYPSAIENLTLAIENGSNDPRAYYFRGLASAALGNIPEAESDFRAGAMIEAQGAYGDLIGRSLARIQGPIRLHIEKIRQRARLAVLTDQRAKDDIRFNQGVRPDVVVPATPPTTGGLPNAIPQPTETLPSDEPAVPPTPEENPFADDPLSGAGEPTVDSSDALGGALDAAQPDPVELPGASGDTPAPAPGATPPAGDEPFPFGGDAGDGAADDPFSF